MYLLNDLEALGYAVSVLPKSSLRCLSGSPNDNEFQAIVMGLGTGFNISLACNSSNTVFAAEMGHAAFAATSRYNNSQCSWRSPCF